MARTKTKRGPASCEDARAEAAPLREIEFTNKGAPTGTNKNKFSNMVALKVRDQVSCGIKNWALVDPGLKEAIWNDIRGFWNITKEKYKKPVIKYMGERWKAWKTRLRRDFITKADPNNPRNPWDHGHPKVEAHEWEVFKAYANSEEFKKLSEQGKANAAKNDHPHRLGSGGYETARLKWNPSAVISMESGGTKTRLSASFEDRCFRWLMARAIPTEEKGVYIIPNPVTQEVAIRVKLISQEVSDEEWLPHRHNDVLTKSLGTKEHGGRARGESGWVGLKASFGKATRRPIHSDCYTKAETQQLIDEALQAQAQGFHQQMADILRLANVILPVANQSPEQVQSRPHTQVSSNCEVMMPHQGFQKSGLCDIFATLDAGIVMVAQGRIENTLGKTVHHSVLKPNELRVCIDRVLEGFEQLDLPFPNEEQEVLGHAQGGFVKWPAGLVQPRDKGIIVEMQADQPQQDVQPRMKSVEPEDRNDKVATAESVCYQQPLLDHETVQKLNKLARFLYNVLLTIDGTIEMSDWKIFGYKEGEHCTWLLKEDITDVFKDDHVSLRIVQVFCLACEDRLKLYCSTRFLFLDPFICAAEQMAEEHGLDRTTAYLRSFFHRVEDKSSFMLLPYLQGNHWVLFIVQLSTLTLYIVNSLDHDYAREPLDIQFALTAALNLHLLDKPKNKRKSKFKINILQSPKQSGSTECGYYLMRAMYDITSKFAEEPTLPAVLHPGAPKPYPESEIEEVKDVLVGFIQRTLLC